MRAYETILKKRGNAGVGDAGKMFARACPGEVSPRRIELFGSRAFLSHVSFGGCGFVKRLGLRNLGFNFGQRETRHRVAGCNLVAFLDRYGSQTAGYLGGDGDGGRIHQPLKRNGSRVHGLPNTPADEHEGAHEHRSAENCWKDR